MASRRQAAEESRRDGERTLDRASRAWAPPVPRYVLQRFGAQGCPASASCPPAPCPETPVPMLASYRRRPSAMCPETPLPGSGSAGSGGRGRAALGGQGHVREVTRPFTRKGLGIGRHATQPGSRPGRLHPGLGGQGTQRANPAVYALPLQVDPEGHRVEKWAGGDPRHVANSQLPQGSHLPRSLPAALERPQIHTMVRRWGGGEQGQDLRVMRGEPFQDHGGRCVDPGSRTETLVGHRGRG